MLCVCIETLVWLLAQRAVLVVGLSLSFIESLSSHANELTPGRGVRSASALCLSSTSPPLSPPLYPPACCCQAASRHQQNECKIMRQPKHKNCAVMCCMLHERERGREGEREASRGGSEFAASWLICHALPSHVKPANWQFQIKIILWRLLLLPLPLLRQSHKDFYFTRCHISCC